MNRRGEIISRESGRPADVASEHGSPSSGSRRFTDREIGAIIEYASKLEEARTDDRPSGGLSLEELLQIAEEVGISRSSLERAIAHLDRGTARSAYFLKAPATRRAVHVVPGAVDPRGLERLLHLVDEEVGALGRTSEALGSISWIGRERSRSTRVSVTPREDDTTIEVVEKTDGRLRRLLHVAPAVWTAIFIPPFVGQLQLSTAGSLGLGALAIAGSVLLGRGIWTMISARSLRRVRRLGRRLVEEAISGQRTEEALVAAPIEPSIEGQGEGGDGRGDDGDDEVNQRRSATNPPIITETPARTVIDHTNQTG